MIEFNNLKEMKPYYNENTNTYEFIEDNHLLDIQCKFDIHVDSNILVRNIIARNIKSLNIEAEDIKAWEINAWNINARDIKTEDIKAWEINAWNIEAGDIKAKYINARDIIFFSVCFAYEYLRCKTIEGRINNAKYFCLNREIEFIKE